jgi:hypothetical protein
MTESTPSWMVGTGKETDMQGEASTRKPFRVWMPAGESRKLVFLHEMETSPVIWEHQYQRMRDGKMRWNNFATCHKPIDNQCPMCDFAAEMGKGQRTKVRLFSVLDLSPWVHKGTGKTHAYSKVVLAAKIKTSDTIIRRYTSLIDQGKPLTGATFEVFRSKDSKSPASGDDYQYISHFDLTSIPEEDRKPHDWMIYAPDLAFLADEVRILRGGQATGTPQIPTAQGAYAAGVGGPGGNMIVPPDEEVNPVEAVEVDD